jgi:tetratricopeptide (TPR) repeat protein
LTSVEEVLGRARLYSAARQFDKAAEVLGSALQSHPEEPALLVAMSRVRLHLNDPVAAASSAHSALTRAPEHTDAMRVYAAALDSLGRRDDAMSVAYRAVCTDPQNHLTHFTYASVLLNGGHAPQALTAAMEAVRLQPGDAENHFLAGRILARLNRVHESSAAYEETLRLDPQHADAAHNIAVNRLNRGHWTRALDGLLGAARMDPSLGDHVRRNIGVALIRPLRWTTPAAVLLCCAAVVCTARPEDVVPRIVVAAGAVAVTTLLVWITRLVPASARRSVVRTRPMLAVRAGHGVGAVLVAVVAATGLVPGVVLSVAMLLVLAGVVLTVIGWLTGS